SPSTTAINRPSSASPRPPPHPSSTLFPTRRSSDLFLRDVIQRTSIHRPENMEESKFLAEITKRFRVDVLGNNLFRLAYRANDPQIGRAHSELQSPDHLVCRLLLEKKKSSRE